MQESRKCDICNKPCFQYAYLCHEHYLLKEAAYGVNDIEQGKDHFKERAVTRLMQYVKFKMKQDKYSYPIIWGPVDWWEKENEAR